MAACNDLRLHHSLRGVYYILDHLKNLRFIHFYFMCVGFLSACMSVQLIYEVHAEARGIGSLGSGVREGLKMSQGCWESNPGTL